MLTNQQIGLQELQIAIFNALNSTGYNVYQYLPKTAPYPFIVMGEEYTVPAHTKNKTHFEVNHVIHTFSKSKNKREINAMNSAIVAALTNELTLSGGFYINDFRLDSGLTLLDPDERELFHGNFRFYYRISHI